MKKTTAQYCKHYLEKSDTLQGLALRYNCSTNELRRINKLYSNDSIFLRQFLLVPASKQLPTSKQDTTSSPPPKHAVEKKLTENDLDAFSYLQQLDSKITAGKNAVKYYKPVDTNAYHETNPSGKYFKSADSFQSSKGPFALSQSRENHNLFQL